MFCENCGKQTPDGQRLCPECAGQTAPQAAPQIDPGETQVLDNLHGYMPMNYQHQVPQQPQQAYQAPQQTYQPQQPVYQPQQPVYQPQQQAYQYQAPQQNYQPQYQAPQQNYQPQYQAPQQTYQQPQYQAPQQPAFEVSRPAAGKKPAKKRGGKTGLIVAAVVLVAIIAVVALCWNSISGFIARNFGDPTDYMVRVEKKNAATAVSSLTDAYGSVLERLEKTDNVAAEADISLELGDSIIALVETLLTQEGMELDMDWLEEVNVSAFANIKDGDYAVDLGIGVNGTNLLTAKLIVDSETLDVYMAIPELNKTYLVISAEEMGMDPAQFQEVMTQSTKLTKTMVAALPEAEVVEELINTYLDLILGQLKDVEKETRKVTANGVEQELLVLTVKLSQRDILDIAEAVMKHAKDDKKLLAVLDDMSGLVNEMPDTYEPVDLRAEFVDSVTAMLEELEYTREDAGTETYLTLETYVDDDEVIVGRTVTVEEDGQEQELYYIRATKGDKFGFEADLAGVVIEGSGTQKDDTITGEFLYTAYDSELLTLELDNFGTNKDGGIQGGIKLIPQEALLSEMGLDSSVTSMLGGSLALEISMEGEEAALRILTGSNTLLGLAASVKEVDATTVSVPGDAVSINDNEAGNEWLADVSFDQVVSNMKAAGVSDELVSVVEMLASMFASEFQ